jgi:hypothetical protein
MPSEMKSRMEIGEIESRPSFAVSVTREYPRPAVSCQPKVIDTKSDRHEPSLPLTGRQPDVILLASYPGPIPQPKSNSAAPENMPFLTGPVLTIGVIDNKLEPFWTSIVESL